VAVYVTLIRRRTSMKLICRRTTSYRSSALLCCQTTSSACRYQPLPNATAGYSERLSEPPGGVFALGNQTLLKIRRQLNPAGSHFSEETEERSVSRFGRFASRRAAQ
jgi:hypothetical protein